MQDLSHASMSHFRDAVFSAKEENSNCWGYDEMTNVRMLQSNCHRQIKDDDDSNPVLQSFKNKSFLCKISSRLWRWLRFVSSSVMEFPGRGRCYLVCYWPRSSLSKFSWLPGFPSLRQGPASQWQSPQDASRGDAAPALSTWGPVAAGFPFHCPGCDLDSRVPRRPHTWPTVVFILFTEGKGNLTGILQKLQNARLRIPGYRPPFRSLSLIQLKVHLAGSVSTCVGQLPPELVCLPASPVLIFNPGSALLPSTLRFWWKKVAFTQVWRIPAKFVTSAFCTFPTIFFKKGCSLWLTLVYSLINRYVCVCVSVLLCVVSLQICGSVVSDSLQPHGLQHARLPCPLPSPGTCSNSCPSSRWFPLNHVILCHPLLLPSILPSIRVFSSELALHIRWPKY